MSGTPVAQGGDAGIVPNRLLITICTMLATLMQALDSTVANVALPYMQGSLSASYDQVTWVLTSYVIAAAIFTAPVGWLTARYGRKNLFVVCLIGFTITSMLCGFANSLPQMVLYRLLQGMFGAALVPLSQATLLDIYPLAQRGSAMSLWGMGVMLGPIFGPTLGGYLTFYYNWRFVFFVNLPFGILATIGILFFLPRDEAGKNMRFDWMGFGILSIGLAALQIMLDRGQELDWFSSTTIIVSTLVAGLGVYLFVVHLITAKNPFIPRAAFGDRNFNASLVVMFSVGLTLLASSTLLTPFLENLSNYPVATAGLIMVPRGLGTMAAMLIAGRLTNKMDPRILMLVGFLMLLVPIYLLEGWTPDVSIPYMAMTIIIQGAGQGFVFVSLQIVAFYTLAPSLRGQGTALISLVRNIGSAIGISITSALFDRETQYEHAVLSQFITPFSRPLQAGGAVNQMLDARSPAGAALLNSMIDRQSQIIAYVDDYKFLFFITIPAVLCLLILRGPPRAAKRQVPSLPAE